MVDHQGRSPARRRGRVIALVIGLLLLAALALVATQFSPRLRSYIIEEANKQGVRLNFADYSLGFSQLRLNGVSFAREQPLPIVGQARSVIIHLAGFKPTTVELEQAQVDILSSIPDLLYELRGLSSGSGGVRQIPVTGSSLLLRWKTSSQDPPLLTLSSAALVLNAGQLQASGDLKVMERLLGRATLSNSLATHKSSLDLVFAGASSGRLNAEINASSDPTTLDVTLKPTHLNASLPGLTLQSKRGGEVSGSLKLAFPSGLSSQSSTGKLLLHFDGFVPPHPPELSGLGFGNRTDLESSLVLSRDYRTITLKDTRLQAGVFALAGLGSVERHDDYATIHLQMNGNLTCAKLASAVVETNLGGALGQLLGSAARQTLAGAVDVAIKVQVDTRDLDAMHIDKTIGVGCGLRPQKLQGRTPLRPPR